MKVQLKRSLIKRTELPTQFEVSNLTLEGKELHDTLYYCLSKFIEGTLDPTLAGKSPDKFISNLQKGILGDFSKRYIITAQDKDRIIGILIALPKEDEQMHIFSLHVSLEYRNKGVGSTLLSKCINDMAIRSIKEILIKEILIDVHLSNKPAYNLYKKYDFKEV